MDMRNLIHLTFQNVIDELVAAIVFMEFFLQSVTEEKLRRAFLALLLSPQEYSDLPLLISIISHLHSSNVVSWLEKMIIKTVFHFQFIGES